MKAPDFWRRPPGFLARLLQPAGALYGAVTLHFMRRTGFAPEIPVIIVGGFDVGGAGKTPACLALAQMLQAQGHRVAFISRGYGGRAAGRAQQVKNRQSAAEIGDEPLLLARAAPTFVGADRVESVRLALAEARPDLLILDDGLQSKRIASTIALAIVDGESGVGNGLCLPAGPLRAPLAEQMAHVSAVVIIGRGEGGQHVASCATALGVPVFSAAFAPAPDAPDLRARRVVAFAGIGLPQKFFTFLKDCGAEIIAQRAFPDHWRYSDGEIDALQKIALAHDALLITTEKDFTRLPPSSASRPHIMPVKLRFDEEAQFLQWLRARLDPDEKSALFLL